jgi:hypothetical protein
VPETRDFASNHDGRESTFRSPHEETDLNNLPSSASAGWLDDHRWPLTAAIALLVTAMAYSLWWNPLTHQGSSWNTPSDLWYTYRAAQYVGWGFEGEIYKSQSYFDSFPGIAVLLAPLAKLGGALNLSTNFLFGLPRPSTWLILGPANAILGGVLLFPLDALARRLRVPSRRRVVLICVEAALIFITAVVWGHPEYTVALAFAIYGLLATIDGKWIRVGIFMGLALLFQPLTVLMLPVVILYLPARRWGATTSIVALPSVILLIPPLLKEWHATTYTLLRQPNYPTVDHPTPWLSLAPVIERSHRAFAEVPKLVNLPNGTQTIKYVRSAFHVDAVVSAGPGRLVALVLACAIGIYVAKTKPNIATVVWWVAACLSLRCVFECVMNPYYLLPAAALILVVAARLNNVRFMVISLALAASTVLSYRFMSPWLYYASVVGLLVIALVSARPQVQSPQQLETNVESESNVRDTA